MQTNGEKTRLGSAGICDLMNILVSRLAIYLLELLQPFDPILVEPLPSYLADSPPPDSLSLALSLSVSLSLSLSLFLYYTQ